MTKDQKDPLNENENCNILDFSYGNKNPIKNNKWNLPGGEQYKTLVDCSLDIITILDKKGNILFQSPSFERILGYKIEDTSGTNAFDFVHPEDLPGVMSIFYEGLLNPGKRVNVEYRFRKADGSYTYLESVGTNFLSDPKIRGIVVNSREIIRRKTAEIENERLRTAVEQSYESIVITDLEGSIQYVNKKFEQVTGYSRDEVIGKNPRLLKSGYTPEEEYKKLWMTINDGNVWEGMFRNKRKNGEYYWESARITPVKNQYGKVTNFIAIKDDISELKKREEELTKMLEEKEIILREIHHRVKNNLQIISSLLKLQSESVNDPSLRSHLRVGRNRIKSMALIHQQLFSSPDLRHIEIEDYLYSLSGQIYSTFNELPEKVSIKISARAITFNVETAIPFGLIVSELMSNSLKHAFVKRTKGQINIVIEKTDTNAYKLIFRDDGIGIPCEMINGSKDSAGLFLIHTLSAQIDGNVKIDNKLGTTFEIEFKDIRQNFNFRKKERTLGEDNRKIHPLYKKSTSIP